jgi:hypothetical protein
MNSGDDRGRRLSEGLRDLNMVRSEAHSAAERAAEAVYECHGMTGVRVRLRMNITIKIDDQGAAKIAEAIRAVADSISARLVTQPASTTYAKGEEVEVFMSIDGTWNPAVVDEDLGDNDVSVVMGETIHFVASKSCVRKRSKYDVYDIGDVVDVAFSPHTECRIALVTKRSGSDEATVMVAIENDPIRAVSKDCVRKRPSVIGNQKPDSEPAYKFGEHVEAFFPITGKRG